MDVSPENPIGPPHATGSRSHAGEAATHKRAEQRDEGTEDRDGSIEPRDLHRQVAFWLVGSLEFDLALSLPHPRA